ncbi:MAG: LysE family translocator [Legionellaceae bacterium]|nr:LysE family translocator [Legionellaceae bacterium]
MTYSLILLSYAISTAVLILSPGPIVILVIRSSTIGLKNAIPTIVGSSISSLILITTVLCFIYTGKHYNSYVFEGAKIAGGIYLMLLSYHLISVDINCQIGTSTKSSFIQALVTGLSNPKDIIFLVSFLQTFIVESKPYVEQSAYLITIWFVIDLIIIFTYAELASRLFKSEKFKKFLHFGPPIIIFLLGLFVFISSILYLIKITS